MKDLYSWGCHECVKMCIIFNQERTPPVFCPYGEDVPCKFTAQKRKK